MEPRVFNVQTCRLYGNRYKDGVNISTPKLTVHHSGKFTITNPVWEALQTDFVEIWFEEETGKLYMHPSTEEKGFKLRTDGKSNYKGFNSAGLFKALSEFVFKPAAKKRVKSASLEVIIIPENKTSKLLEINYSKPLYFVDEFNPDSK